MDVQLGLLAAFAALAFVVPGLFGNALLYAHIRSKVEHALAANATMEDACTMLKRSATSRQRLIGLALLNAVLLGAVVGGYFAFPDAGQMGAATQITAQARNAVVGKTLELAAVPVATASAPALAPAALASAPLPGTAAVALAASAPIASVSAPQLAASAPLVAASAPQVKASVPTAASPASAPLVAASSPVKTASAAKTVKTVPAKVAAPQKPKAKPPASPASAAGNGKAVPGAIAQNKDPRFLINVGLFADENNTRNTYTKLTDAGLNVLSNEINGKKGKLTRIRVGPFASQAEADRAAEKIRALKLDAVVVSQ
jgi:cell division septation protein DedD